MVIYIKVRVYGSGYLEGFEHLYIMIVMCLLRYLNFFPLEHDLIKYSGPF